MGEEIIENHHGKHMYSKGFLLLSLCSSIFLAAVLTCASPARSFEFPYPLAQENRVARSLPDEVFPPLFPWSPLRGDSGSLSKTNIPFADRFLSIWKFELFVIDRHAIRVNQIVMAILAFFIGLAVLGQVIRLFKKRVLPKTTLKPNEAATAAKLLYYFGMLLVLLLSLRIIHIPLTAFAFVGGALAIGVGFGAQNLINNFISGFILMAERPIRVGDVIEIEGNFATVEDIGPRSTRIRTGDNIHVLVPNSSFLEKNIVNWTLSDKMVRTHVAVGVAYGSPVREVEALLLKAVSENENILKTPKPFVLFKDFGDNALLFYLYFWVSMDTVTQRLIIESNIRFRIDDLFREAGIVIAFPQRDVHLDASRPLELKILRGDEGREREK
jgi:small-conductance mechanosensitive channel